MLEDWDSGLLRGNVNSAIVKLGHGHMQNISGNILDIGGGTGGGSRRAIDNWTPPGWRQFLADTNSPGIIIW